MDYWSFRGEKAWWSSESIPGYFRGLFAFQVTSSPRDNPIIARRTGVGNNLVEVLSGVVRLALIAGVG